MSTTRDYVQPGVVDSSTRPYAGFTLVSHVGSADVHLIDMNGAVVHKWRTPAELGTHAVLLPNGNLLCATRIDKGPLSDLEGAAGSILELDWNGKVVWQHEDPYMHHDFCRMPNGNTIFLRWVPTPNDMAVKVKGGLPGTEREGIMWSDSLREIDPTGQVVWEWVGYEHLNPEVDIICPICFRNEWTHANSFKVTSEGQVLISFMKTNTIALLNREEGYVYWRWGGFRVLGHPHDVSWLGDETVMVLGCGGHNPGFEIGESEILRVDVRANSVLWEFKEYVTLDFYTPCKGGFQRLPNGNVLVCEGDRGRIFEVSQEQAIVWEYVNPFNHLSPMYGQSNMLFRAFRYGLDYEGLQGNVAAPQRQVERETAAPPGAPASKAAQAVRDRLSKLGY